MSFAAPAVLAVFCIAYGLVFAEEKLHLRKSKPVMVAAGLIWIIVAAGFAADGRGPAVTTAIRHVVLEYAELLLFLLSAMSFVNALVERQLFDALRARLTAAKMSVRGIFWLVLSFTGRRQSDHRLGDGNSGDRGARPSQKSGGDRADQHRGGGQCGWCLFAVRRHHDFDGLAEG